MRPPNIEQLASELLPGRGALTATHLGSGLYYDSYQLSRGAVRCILKLARASAGAVPLAWEASVVEAAGRRGLAPPLLRSDVDRGFILYRYVDGRTLSGAEVRRGVSMAAVAALIRGIQALPIPPGGRYMAPAAWLEHYRRALEAAGLTIGAELWRRAGTHAAALRELPEPQARIAHSDLHRFNVLEAAGRLVLLDWEYAHLNEPMWDVAGWVANNDFDAALAAAFLDAFLTRPATKAERARLEHLVWLYDYVCLLWSTLFLAGAASHGAAALKKRRDLLQTRLCGVSRLWQTSAKPTEN